MIPSRITIHCADSPNGKVVPAAEIRQWHLARGWTDIGYHLVIQPTGEVEKGRPLNVQGAHVEGANEGNVGICLVGRDHFPVEQFKALRYQLDSLMMCFQSIPKFAVYCHNQFESARLQGKKCPNMEINNLLRWYFAQDEKAIEAYILKP